MSLTVLWCKTVQSKGTRGVLKYIFPIQISPIDWYNTNYQTENSGLHTLLNTFLKSIWSLNENQIACTVHNNISHNLFNNLKINMTEENICRYYSSKLKYIHHFVVIKTKL